MRKLKIVWVVATFLAMVLVPTGVGWFIQNSRNPDLGPDPAATPRALVASGSVDAAMAACEFLIANDLDPDGTVEQTRQEILDRSNSLYAKGKGFLYGGLTGKIDDPSSLAGCIAADLTVYGDARDLVKNAVAYVRGEEVDQLVTALSTIGLATTLAPNIDVGISVCKNLGRFMSTSLRSHVLDLALEARKIGKLDKIAGLVSDIGGLWKRLGAGCIDLFKMAGDVPGFQALVRLIDRFGKPAFGAVLVGGKATIRCLAVVADSGLKLAGSSGKRLIRMAVVYPNVAAHLVKIAKKAGYDHPGTSLLLATEILGAMPLWVIALIGFAIWYFCSFWTILELLTPRKPAPVHPEPVLAA